MTGLIGFFRHGVENHRSPPMTISELFGTDFNDVYERGVMPGEETFTLK